jgi:DASS family divalent anion:Na+ symporter
MVLAGMIPSNGARSAGVVLPIVRSIAELYGSHPGETAERLGAYLMSAVYQAVCVTSAMFITGQVSNFIARDLAHQVGYEISPAGWIRATIVPGLLSMAVVPWLTMRVIRPTIQKTPEARKFAAAELAKMGPLQSAEWILAGVFAIVCFFWVTSRAAWGFDITVTALLGCMVLLLTGVLTWEDIRGEKAGWGIFIWYGGLYRLAQGLNDAGVTKAFANAVGSQLGGHGWQALFAITIVIYFYAHYAFASITAHMLSMFPAFLAVLLMKGAPIGLAVWTFACLANLSACLTHYGTTPAPVYFAQDYVSLKKWWQAGALASVAHLVIWTTAGFAWWKLIGIW